VTAVGSSLTISGDLHFSSEYSSFLFGGPIGGLRAGSFSLNATAVPEPSSLAMMGVAACVLGGTLARRRTRIRKRAQG